MTYGEPSPTSLRSKRYLEDENLRLTRLLTTVCGKIHVLSAELYRLEFGIPEDGVGQINMFPVMRRHGDGEQSDQVS